MQLKKAMIEHSKGLHMLKLTAEDAIEASKELSHKGYILYTYYCGKGSGWVFNDEVIGQDLDITARSVAKYKKELVDKGYLLVESTKNMEAMCVGKSAIKKFLGDKNGKNT